MDFKFKLFLIGLLIVVLIFGSKYFFTKLDRNNKASNKFLGKQLGDGWHLVTWDTGYVPNVFSMGYNRHLCYDDENRTWWIFYYRNIGKNIRVWDRFGNSAIVYKYSTNNGKTWSDEYYLVKGKYQAADFTIDCSPPFISVAYSSPNQPDVLWKKGRMDMNSIEWIVSSVAMPPAQEITHVAPSVVYYNGIPVIVVRDQSEEGKKGGRKKTFASVAKDSHGKEWNSEVVIYDGEVSRPHGEFASASLAIAKNRLFALIFSEPGYIYMSEYMGENNWSKAMPVYNFGNTTYPDWVTITDSKGNLHVFYPEREVNRTRHAIFDGDTWRFENLTDKSTSNRQISASIDERDHIFVVHRNVELLRFADGTWNEKKLLTDLPSLNIGWVNMMQSLINGKLGIALVEGKDTQPNIWFSCLEKVASASGSELHWCK